MESRQITCGREVCRRAHRRELNRQWWITEEACRKTRYEKVRDRRCQEGYWKNYRDINSDYAEMNRRMTRERMRRLRAGRREAEALLQDPIGVLEALRGQLTPLFATRELLSPKSRGKTPPRPSVFATQELLARNSEGTLRFLIAREVFATRDPGDKAGGVRVNSEHEGHRTKSGSLGISLREAADAPA